MPRTFSDELKEQEVLFAAAADMAEKLGLSPAKDYRHISELADGDRVILADPVSIRMGQLQRRLLESKSLRWESSFLDGKEIYQRGFLRPENGEWPTEAYEESFLLNPETVLYC